jgi:hypothetical protein
MPDFCSENTETITDANYKALYSSSDTSLPNGGTGFPESSTSSNGLVNNGEIKVHLDSLLSKMNAVAPSGETTKEANNKEIDETKVFSENAAKLRKNLTTEYCFYYKRYIYILHDILTTAATMGGESKPQEYKDKKLETEKLNAKLNQILQILQALINSRLTSLQGYYGESSGVNQLNQQLDTTRTELIRHSQLLKNADLEKDLKAAMVDYSVEKNSSSRNLLAIYGFMNIVAAGLIFYLYRSAKSE